MTGTVIQVGEGRGFIIATEEARYVITAAHCLPELPPAHPCSYLQERTYADFLGLLGGPRDVWAECLFVDPVADLAVLCQPDGHALYDEADAYNRLTEEGATSFTFGRLPTDSINLARVVREARMFSLGGEWFPCQVSRLGRGLWIEDTAQPIEAGMSGSPIILPDGSTIAVVCTSVEGSRDSGPHPELRAHLPAWLVRKVVCYAADEQSPATTP